MWNLFKKKSTQEDNYFEMLYGIFQCLTSEEGSISIKVKDQTNEVECLWYQIPYSFDEYDEHHKALKDNKLNNFYELLNKVYAAANIHPLDVNVALKDELQYDFMQLNFYTDPKSELEKLWVKRVNCSFYFFFVREDGSKEIDSCRVFYRRANDYTINNLLFAKHITNLHQPNPDETEYFDLLECNIVALAEYTGVKIPTELKDKYPDSLLLENATVSDFERIISLVNYNDFEEDIAQKARYLYDNYQMDWNELDDEEYYSDYFPLRYQIINADSNIWQSDWKFNPEDAQGFIEDLLGESWTFKYPEETYSHDLFPFIKKGLAAKSLALMNFDTGGDSYDFFLVQLQDVSEILNLSVKLNLGIEVVE